MGSELSSRSAVTSVEIKPGRKRNPSLVVHGPLLALLALELPRIHAPEQAVRSFGFRLTRPAFVPARLIAAGGPTEITVGAHGAEPSLTATVSLRRRAEPERKANP